MDPRKPENQLTQESIQHIKQALEISPIGFLDLLSIEIWLLIFDYLSASAARNIALSSRHGRILFDNYFMERPTEMELLLKIVNDGTERQYQKAVRCSNVKEMTAKGSIGSLLLALMCYLGYQGVQKIITLGDLIQDQENARDAWLASCNTSTLDSQPIECYSIDESDCITFETLFSCAYELCVSFLSYCSAQEDMRNESVAYIVPAMILLLAAAIVLSCCRDCTLVKKETIAADPDTYLSFNSQTSAKEIIRNSNIRLFSGPEIKIIQGVEHGKNQIERFKKLKEELKQIHDQSKGTEKPLTSQTSMYKWKQALMFHRKQSKSTTISSKAPELH